VSDETSKTKKEFEEFALLVAQAGSSIGLDEAAQLHVSKRIGMELSELALQLPSIEEELAHGAAGYLRRPADAGDPEAAHELAELYIHAPNSNGLEDGYEYYKIAADKGHAHATYQLARCHLKGEGPPKDYKRAAELFAEAKRQGATMDSDHLELDDLSPEEKRIMRWSLGSGEVTDTDR